MKDIFQEIRAIFLYLFAKKWLILLIGFLGGIAGILVATFEKPRYESRLTFSLQENGGGLSGALSLAAEFGFNLGGGGESIFAGDNIMNILTSRRIIEGVLLSADTIDGKPQTMANLYMVYSKLDFSKKPRIGPIHYPVNANRGTFSYHQDSILFSIYDGIIKNQLRVKRPDKRLNYYEITFKSPNERFSKVFTEKLIALSTDFYVNLKSQRAKETLAILQDRAMAMRGGVKTAIQKQASIRDANLNPAFNNTVAGVQQQQVDATAFGKAYEELFKTLELARYQYLQNLPLLQVIDAPNYPLKKLKKGRLMTGILGAALAGFLGIIVLLMKKQIATVNSKANQATGKV